MDTTPSNRSHHREPWNKGKLTGQKAPFKPKDIWALRVRLQPALAASRNEVRPWRLRIFNPRL
jgi:hypothetical protein